MKLKIFSCNHQAPTRGISTPLFQTLISGIEPLPHTTVATDTAGTNIARLEKFCELRHQFYVWQNQLSELDYVGFEHYRRLFYIDPLSEKDIATRYPLIASTRARVAAEPWASNHGVPLEGLEQFLAMRENFNEQDIARIQKWVGDHDIICTHLLSKRVDIEFKESHKMAHELWDIFSDMLRATWPKLFGKSYVEWPSLWSTYLNMYILRTDLFAEYMELLFPTLLTMDKRFPDAPQRIWGHMSERVFGAFIMQKRMEQPTLRVRTIPYLFFSVTSNSTESSTKTIGASGA